MTGPEQAAHELSVGAVRAAIVLLRQLPLGLLDVDQAESDDLAVAVARLENWLTENVGRWAIPA